MCWRVLFVQIEERISIDILEQLKDAFILADVDGNGKLDFEEFKAVFKMELSLSDAKVWALLNYLAVAVMAHLRTSLNALPRNP